MTDQPAPTPATLSRRRLMLTGAAVPFSAEGMSADGDASRAWLANHREMRRLLLRWGDLEADLARASGWYDLTDDERTQHPGQAMLKEIDERIGKLADICDGLLPVLTRAPTRSPIGILLKMRVATEIVDPVDQPEGHALVRSLLRDLSALFQVKAG